MISTIKILYGVLKKYIVAFWIAMFFMVMVDIFAYLTPVAVQYIIDNIFPNIKKPGVINYAILAGAIIVIIGFFRGFASHTMIRLYWYVSEKVVRDLRNKLYEKLQHLNASFYSKARTGDLMSRVTTDIQIIRNFFAFGIEHRIRAILIVITVFVIMVMQNWKLALVVYCFIPFVYIIVIFYSKKLRIAVKNKHQQAGKLNANLQESLRGIRIIKAFAMEEEKQKEFDYDNNRLKDINMEIGLIQAHLDPILLVVGGIGILSVMLYSGYQVVNNEISIGVLVAFITYLMLMRFPLTIMAFNISTVSLARGAAVRINEILELDDQRIEGKGSIKKKINGKLEFKNVNFYYDKGNYVLKDLSFSIEAGEHVAIFGLTGSGKSSLISLIPRFYFPASGKIFLDNTDLKEWDLEYLRSQMSTVLQETFLFSISIKENIGFGMPGASMEDIIKVAKLAKIDSFINNLPDGYETIIGEYGVGLSGGQRQRIAIARAILKDPKLLILDDCTSSLDPVTEKEIQKELRELMKGRTTIIIAQRISSLRLADRIIVLDHGKVQDFGSHQVLLEKNELYRSTYETQMLYADNVCEDSMSAR